MKKCHQNGELFITDNYGLGTCVEVRIQGDIISRKFSTDSITCSGKKTTKTEDEIDSFFNNEIFWLNKLKESPWIPETFDIDTENKIIYQKYTQPDLLSIKPNLPEIIPDISEQIIEMYKYFQTQRMYKRNGSLSNLTHDNGQIKAFDFKWATHRPIGLEMELKSYDVWLTKIDKNLPGELRKYVD